LQHSRILTRQTDARNPLAADLRYAAMRCGRSYRRPQREREREMRMLRTSEVDTLSTCKLCDVNVTLGEQRRQFAIATGRYGKTPEEAMLLMPLCETCLTIVMREDRRNRWRNALQGNQ
jgi:hypothetical protein